MNIFQTFKLFMYRITQQMTDINRVTTRGK